MIIKNTPYRRTCKGLSDIVIAMLTTAHAVTGATIGVLVPNPWVAVPLAIGSHFILDRVPHWQETLAPYTPTHKTYVRIPIDLTLSLILVTIVASWHPSAALSVWLGAVFANAPDLDTFTIIMPHLRQGFIARFYQWHSDIQRETSSMWGVATQVGLVIACIGLLQPH